MSIQNFSPIAPAVSALTSYIDTTNIYNVSEVKKLKSVSQIKYKFDNFLSYSIFVILKTNTKKNLANSN